MTRLTGTREATAAEKERGAEVVFTRKGNGKTYIIYGCKCYESWEQWGAPCEVLRDNVDTIEAWRRRRGE